MLQSAVRAQGLHTTVPPTQYVAQGRQSPGDSPGVGGTYPLQLTLGLFSANLVQNRGFLTCWQHQLNASSSPSAEEDGRALGAARAPTVPAERSVLRVF